MSILSSDRVTDWSIAGVIGGIPSYTTVYQTKTASDSLAAIQVAVDNCPDDQVVYLAAGTYDFNYGTLYLRNPRMVLRGAPANATVIEKGFILVQGQPPQVPAIGATTNGGIANWTGGYSTGATSITLDSTLHLDYGTLQVGNLLVLDQEDDPALVNPDGQSGTFLEGQRTGRHQQQLVKVTSVSGSGPFTVGISPGLVAGNWSGSLNPKAFWWEITTAPYNYANVYNIGIENIKLVGEAGDSAKIDILGAWNCWVTGCDWNDQFQRGLAIQKSLHCTVRNNRWNSAQNYGVTCYGVELHTSTAVLIEDNIFVEISTPVEVTGSVGCVIAYNYAVDQIYIDTSSNWMPHMIQFHGSHSSFNLVEGNFGTGVNYDFIHGSAGYNVALRNRFTGRGRLVQANNTHPVMLQAWQRNTSVVGNVLGTAGYHNTYEWLSTGADTGAGAVFRVGHYENNSGTSDPLNDDLTVTTLVRKGNYNTVTGAVPAGESIGGDVVPDSYYLPTKPLWFGDLAYPPVVPTSPSSDPEIIPAGYRYVNDSNPPEDEIVGTPTFSPLPGTFSSPQSVVISCVTPDADIYFTTDGSEPTDADTLYTEAVEIGVTTTLKAIAVKVALTDSGVASGVYTLGCVAPVFTPSAGAFSSAQSVEIDSETAGATIHYTVDGSTPTTGSPTYSSPIEIDETTTLKAIAVKTGLTNSSVTSGTFTIAEVPVAPSGLTATAVSPSQINLTWTDNSSDETGFKILRGTVSGALTLVHTTATGVTSYSNTGLAEGTAYFFKVVAYNDVGDSASTSEGTATTLANVPVPNAPTGLTATAVSTSQINLSWTDVSSNETGFKVYAGTVSGALSLVATLGANATSYQRTGLATSTTYYFKVASYNTSGAALSTQASATTAAPAGPVKLKGGKHPKNGRVVESSYRSSFL